MFHSAKDSSKSSYYNIIITVVLSLIIASLSIAYYEILQNFKTKSTVPYSFVNSPSSCPKKNQGCSNSITSSFLVSEQLDGLDTLSSSKAVLIAPPSSAPPAFNEAYEDISPPMSSMGEGWRSLRDRKISRNVVVEGPPTLNNAGERSEIAKSRAGFLISPEVQLHEENGRPKVTNFPIDQSILKKEKIDKINYDYSSGQSTATDDSHWSKFFSDIANVTSNSKSALQVIFNDYYERFVDDKPAWLWTLVCSLVVMSTGIVPAFLIPERNKALVKTEGVYDKNAAIGEVQLNRLLCFAVGSLLGDVFFHLLPESWSNNECKLNVGLYVIAGLITCFLIEKFCAKSEKSQHYVAALANLAANIVDNFTHGLAVGGSFLISKKLGFLTTFAILLHEIPHEISDFAILLRANFNRWSAIKAQLLTATGGVLGALVALMSSSADSSTVGQKVFWILPFTAGGFLNIALVQILPDILKERRFRESLNQLLLIFVGAAVMGMLNSSLITG